MILASSTLPNIMLFWLDASAALATTSFAPPGFTVCCKLLPAAAALLACKLAGIEVLAAGSGALSAVAATETAACLPLLLLPPAEL
jgi:hypothetical protein